MSHYEKSLTAFKTNRKVSAKAPIQKTNVSKREKGLNAITERFVKAMNTIIAKSKIEKGDVSTLRDFGRKIGLDSTNFSKIKGHAGQDAQVRGVNVKLIEAICSEFDVSPNWLILGKGEMFLNGTDNSLERRLTRIERKLQI